MSNSNQLEKEKEGPIPGESIITDQDVEDADIKSKEQSDQHRGMLLAARNYLAFYGNPTEIQTCRRSLKKMGFTPVKGPKGGQF